MTTKLETRVERGDTDKYNHANYADYLRWYELGHRDYLAQVGLGGFKEIEAQYGVRTFVRKAEVDYLGELIEGDSITVETGVDRIGNTSMTYSQAIKKGEKTSSTAKVTVVFVGEDGTPIQIPEEIKTKLDLRRQK